MTSDDHVSTDQESSPEDVWVPVNEEIVQKDWKKSKIETMEEQEKLLESPTHLLSWETDALIAPPKKTKSTQKKTAPRKTKTVPSDHLLASEHDMLLPPNASDSSL
jgi:hypothetical protein